MYTLQGLSPAFHTQRQKGDVVAGRAAGLNHQRLQLPAPPSLPPDSVNKESEKPVAGHLSYLSV